MRWSPQLLGAILLGIALFIALLILLRFAERRLKKSSLKPGIIHLISGLLGALEIFALVHGMFYFAQDFVLFQPNRDLNSWEYLVAQPAFEAAEVVSGKKTWHGMLRRAETDDPSPLILLFCGNGQNAAQVMRGIDQSGMWPHKDYSYLLMDYAGYGINGGLPSARDMCEEALAAFDYASTLPGVSGVIAGGYSIGTGPATYLAAHREVAGLFLLAPFANSYDLYNSVLPIFYGPLRLAVKHKFLSDEYAQAVRVPALVAASRDDEVIPFASSETLYSRLGGESIFIPLTGVGHGSFLFNRTVLDGIEAYLETLEFH